MRKGKYQVRKILEFELGSAQNKPIRVRGRRGLLGIDTGARRLDIYSDVPGINNLRPTKTLQVPEPVRSDLALDLVKSFMNGPPNLLPLLTATRSKPT